MLHEQDEHVLSLKLYGCLASLNFYAQFEMVTRHFVTGAINKIKRCDPQRESTIFLWPLNTIHILSAELHVQIGIFFKLKLFTSFIYFRIVAIGYLIDFKILLKIF